MLNRTRHLCLTLIFAAICMGASSLLYAQDALPVSVQSQIHTPLSPVGSGTYHKFGFSVYRATLWAPKGVWDASKPYALELHYTRSVSKERISDTVVDDIRDQNTTDEQTFAGWEKTIRDALPAVEDGDIMIGLSVPGKEAKLFFNGTQIASIKDEELGRAFFNIWLGDTADEDLRAALLRPVGYASK
jgi:Chalcone isomerase-like